MFGFRRSFHRTIKYLAASLLSAGILCGTIALRASAAAVPQHAQTVHSGISACEFPSLSAEQVLERAITNCQSLDSYQCRLRLHLTKGNHVQDSEYVFSYQKPNLVRMHVEKGRDRGSTVILRPDGRIRGRREGFLSVLAVTLKPDDQRLYDLWDRSFKESDWVTLLTETKERLNLAAVSRLETTDGGKEIFLYAEGKDLEGASFVEETWLDADRLVLLKKRATRNADRLEATWSDISLNPGFDDNFFNF